MFNQRHLKDSELDPIKFSSRNYRYGFDAFQTQPICAPILGYGTPGGATGNRNLMLSGTYPNLLLWEYAILGAGQTILAPVLADAGLGIELDKTDNEGAEYTPGGTGARGRFCFTIGGNDPAGRPAPAFFMRLKFTESDVSGTDECVIGFRKTEAIAAAYTSYTDYALIGQVTADGKIKTATRLNTGTAVIVDSTQTWADTATHTLACEVYPNGSVRFAIDGAFPTVSQVFTFDAGDVVQPVIRYLHATTTPQDVDLVEFECGYRPRRT